jgi:fatty acid desaturase
MVENTGPHTVSGIFMSAISAQKPVPKLELATVLLLLACYGGLIFSTLWLAQVSLLLAFVLTTFLIALHSSLQHEALHGHPTRHPQLNEALVALPVGLLIPYRRFRDLHLAHHVDEILTDPYDDPESNFLDPKVWARLPAWLQRVYRANNTLSGRILLGPGLSLIALVRGDISAIRRGQRGVLAGWVLHAVGLIPVVWWLLSAAVIPVWLYVIAAYLGFGLLKIRTYLEHRASNNPKARTVIVEDRGILAFLFLNNNLHVVHHSHPGMPWYRLPGIYFADREKYRADNEGYVYKNYWQIFRLHMFRAKDPVPHPLRENAGQ